MTGSVTTQTSSDIVSAFTAEVQAEASGYADFEVGSILLAIGEAVKDVALWLQGLILYLLAATRLSTSSGGQCDSFVADFAGNLDFARLGAVGASVTLTFARLSTSGQTYVPVGATVQTPDGSEVFVVATDTENSAYSANAGGSGVPGYVMAGGTGSVNVPAQASTAGSASNVLAGTLTVITSSIVGVDTVTNAAAATGGADAETDQAMKARFVTYINSLQEGTPGAIENAVTGLSAGLDLPITCSVVENLTYDGASQAGYFYVIVNDGSGSPSDATLAAATTAINAVRPVGATFGVFAPTVVTVNVAVTIQAAGGYVKSALQPIVQAAITSFISALGGGATGQTLSWSQLYQVIWNAAAGLSDATGLTINSATSDLVATSQEVFEPGTITVS